MNHIRILIRVLMILLPFKSGAVSVNAVFDSADTVPITASGYTANGNDLAISLGFEPKAGTRLTVVNNTAISFINGQFGNLSQGQVVTLAYNGISYKFLADYYGGSGNDLVLSWFSQEGAAWGDATNGLLGNGYDLNSSVPMQINHSGVLAGKTITSIAAGLSHSLVLCSDGTLASWGWNVYGQLGNNSTTDSREPVLVSRSSGVLAGRTVTAISTGGSSNLVLCSDGTLATWGINQGWQNGDSDPASNAVPVAVNQSGVLAGKTITAIAAGDTHCLVLCSDGTLAAWGQNGKGQLGNNSTTYSNVPVLVNRNGVLAGKSVTAIAAGGLHSLVLCSDGTLAAWGGNFAGQLGNNSTTDFKVPVSVDRSGILAGKSIDAISAGWSNSLVRCSDGSLIVWGANIGNGGAISNFIVPMPVTPDGLFVGKTVNSLVSGRFHAFALCSDGALIGFGDNQSGQLGNGLTTTSNVPVLVPRAGALLGKDVVKLACGGSHSLAICTDGSLAAWGNNNYGQLGNGGPQVVPSRVVQAATPTGKTMTNVSAGDTHSISLCSDGSLIAWGENNFGQLGNGNTTYSSVPVAVNQSGVLAGKAIAAISTGAFHSLILCSDGTLVAWGRNSCGQLGNGNTNSSNEPVAVTQDGVLAGKTVVAISAGSLHNLVLCSDGTIAAWGCNGDGQLGNGSKTTTAVTTPVLVNQGGVLAGKSPRFISAGDAHSLVCCSDGTLVSWGDNAGGQLGRGDTTDSSSPVLVYGSGVLSGKSIVSISAGGQHNLVLCTDGSLVSWGANSYGQLGDGSTTKRITPVLVNQNGYLFSKTVTGMSAGYSHNLALCSDGTLAAWGLNDSGQLGCGNRTNSSAPVLVNQNELLIGNQLMLISAGSRHSLAVAAISYSGDLSGISTSVGTLSPGFSPAIKNYAISVSNTTTSLAVTPASADPSATIRVNGEIVPSGSVSNAFPLSVGGNTIPVEVTTRDGGVTKTYTLTVTRAFSSVATLSNLTTNVGILSPVFSSGTTAYAAAVSYPTVAIGLIPTASDSAAEIKVNDVLVASGTSSPSLPLSVGMNTITVRVTAQDGSTTKTYTIQVTRAASSVATLSGLDLRVAQLSPKFDRSIKEYTAKVSQSTNSIKVAPTATSGVATIKVNGMSVKSGVLSKAIALRLGKNTIRIVVTAQDGTVKIYKVTVTRGSVAKTMPLLTAFGGPSQFQKMARLEMVSQYPMDHQRFLLLTARKEKGKRQIVEVSPNLVDWYSGDNFTTTLIENDSILQVRDDTPFKQGEKRYIRLRQVP